MIPSCLFHVIAKCQSGRVFCAPDRYTDRVKFPSHEIQHQTRTDNMPATIEASQAYQAISWHDYL